ncbi:MAG: acyl-CoA thioesterase [Candidatus Eisenbacteria bacterium]|uniref:Acyl-CoA thioesterase n=1 Tax=Eiseniibacteriota bacterium TaxID=2212470 RepID=A0A538U0K6_UNCEI|nr:MAG: acyl-CoA thioesterase [Candidatus Eisenbacteria bacterium]
MTAADRPRFPVTHEIRPRFRDTDAMGHLNNAVYVTYLEVARQVYWERLDGGSDYRRVPFILAHVTIDFRSEALVSEALEIAIRCDWIGSKSFAFVYQIRERSTGRLVVDATTIQVCYDYATKHSIPLPPELERKLETLEGRPLRRASRSDAART